MLQYRIFLDSFFQWLRICRPFLRKSRKISVTEMAIQREPLLNMDYSANFEEVSSSPPLAWNVAHVLYVLKPHNQAKYATKNLDLFTPQEDIYDVVADARQVQKVDPVTGKEKQQPRARMPLFIPGRIIHITWAASQQRYKWITAIVDQFRISLYTCRYM